jgi:hypothetical protein
MNLSISYGFLHILVLVTEVSLQLVLKVCGMLV